MSIESVSLKIRSVVKDIVCAYVHHIKYRISQNDVDYINLGLDENIDIYEDIFKNIMQVWLKNGKSNLPKRVIDETIEAMVCCVEHKNNTYFIDKFPDVIYRTSLAVLKETKEGVRGECQA